MCILFPACNKNNMGISSIATLSEVIETGVGKTLKSMGISVTVSFIFATAVLVALTMPPPSWAGNMALMALCTGLSTGLGLRLEFNKKVGLISGLSTGLVIALLTGMGYTMPERIAVTGLAIGLLWSILNRVKLELSSSRGSNIRSRLSGVVMLD